MQSEGRSETMWEKQLCRPKVSEEGGGRTCFKQQSRDSPAARGEDHGEAGCLPPAMEVYGAADFRPTLEQGDAWRRLWSCGELALEQAPARTCGPVERGAHAGARLLAGLVTPWGTHAEAICSWRTASRGKEPHWRNSWRSVSLGGDPTLEQGQRVKRKEWQRLHVTNWPQPPFPDPLHSSGVGSREFESEVNHGKKGGVGGRCSKM